VRYRSLGPGPRDVGIARRSTRPRVPPLTVGPSRLQGASRLAGVGNGAAARCRVATSCGADILILWQVCAAVPSPKARSFGGPHQLRAARATTGHRFTTGTIALQRLAAGSMMLPAAFDAPCVGDGLADGRFVWDHAASTGTVN